jgi:hypothetical protein
MNNNVFVRFAAVDDVVKAKQGFDANDVADAFDTVLQEKSCHSVNRLLRMFKLRNQNLFRKIKTALHSICQMELHPVYHQFGMVYITHDHFLQFKIWGSKPVRQPPCATEERQAEVKTNKIPGRMFAWCAILGTSVVTAYQLGMLTTLLP